MKYLVITQADAARIGEALAGAADPDLRRIAARLTADTGGDMQEIADELKRTAICATCSLEGRAGSCVAIGARAAGRRLARLLERARGERPAGRKPLDVIVAETAESLRTMCRHLRFDAEKVRKADIKVDSDGAWVRVMCRYVDVRGCTHEVGCDRNVGGPDGDGSARDLARAIVQDLRQRLGELVCGQ